MRIGTGRVSTAKIIDFVNGLAAAGLTKATDVRLVAHATLAMCPEDIAVIDAAFAEYWQSLLLGAQEDAEGEDLEMLPNYGHRDEDEAVVEGDGFQDHEGFAGDIFPDEDVEDRPEAELTETAVYSAKERFKSKDFARFTEAEFLDAQRFLRAITWQPPRRRSRRRVSSKTGSEIDMRRLLRKSLHTGGEVLTLPRRGMQTKPRRLVLLCDISGSMDTYTRMFLQFLHTLHLRLGAVEVFVFATRLTRITHLLRHKDADTAISEVTDHVQDWAGGTRIGDVVGTFNREWAKRVAAHGAVIMIISDGWDRGDAEKLACEMKRLHRLSHRLIWLNPLLGSTAYEPLTQGMRAALPHVDEFLPAHNIASLESLASVLNQIGTGTSPVRNATI